MTVILPPHRGALFAGALALAGLAATASEAATLYGATHGQSTGGSVLYTIDTVTGAGTAIGAIGYDVNGLTYDATTDTLFATVRTDFTGYALLALDRLTGAGSIIGGMNTNLGQVWGVTANTAGALFGWTETSDDMVSIDKGTGVATVVGPSPTWSTNASFAFDSGDNLYLIQDWEIWLMDPSTGGGTEIGALPSDPGHHGTFSETDALWTVLTNGNVQDSVLRVTDMTTLASFDIDTDVEYLHTLAFVGTATQPIPVPASLPLLALGLGLLGITRRRRG
jgi:hypothetical protein